MRYSSKSGIISCESIRLLFIPLIINNWQKKDKGAMQIS